jgi:MFS family permease
MESKVSYYGWVVVGMAFLANLAAYGVVFAYSVFFKPLTLEFGWNRTVTAGAFSIYAIVHNILAFFCGKLVDRFGPKIVLTAAGFFIGLSMVLMSYISNIWQLYVVYGLFLSVGIACTYAPVMATVSRWFAEKRGMAVGFTAAGIGAGSIVFSPLSAWLISSFDWRFSFFVLGISTWIIFIPVVRFLKRNTGIIETSKNNSRIAEGITFAEAFKTLTFWAYCCAWMFAAFAQWAIFVHIVPVLTDRGITIVQAGLMAGLMGGTSLAGRVCSGLISDKVGRKEVFITALAIQLAALVWLAYSNDLWMFFVFVVIFGFGSGGWGGVIAAFPADYFGLKETGSILGFGAIMCGIGVACGPFMGGYVFDVTGSYQIMVMLCIITGIAAIASAFFIRYIR